LIAVGVREPSAVVFVDPKSLKVVHRVALPAPPRHLTYDTAAGTVLVPTESANELVAVRPGGVVTATKVGTHPHDATAVDADVFVADEHSDQVSVLRHAHLVKNLPTPHQPGGIADTQGDQILVFAIGPYPRLLDAPRDRLWVTETATDRLAEYSLRGKLPRRVAAYPTVRQPNSAAVDPRSGAVFVAGRDKGRLERIAPRGGKR
jgi:hypothetical protein